MALSYSNRQERHYVASPTVLNARAARISGPDFLARAEYDVLSPVRVIRNLPNWILDDLLSDGVTPNAAVNEHLQTVIGQATRLERMVSDMFSYERMRFHKLRPVELCAHTRLMELSEIILPDGPWSIEILGDLPPLNIDPVLFDVIFSALFDNAVKHHPDPSGFIRMHIEPGEESFHLSVIDNGAGIPLADRARMFEPFETLYPRDDIDGSGLGLAKVLRGTGLLEGALELADGPDGTGTRITISLPKTLCVT